MKEGDNGQGQQNEEQADDQSIRNMEFVADERQDIKPGKAGEKDGQGVKRQRIAGQHDQKAERIERHGRQPRDPKRGKRRLAEERDQPHDESSAERRPG